MRYRFFTADVFTDQIFGGNQLAVFPNADGLETAQMQQVAKEFNLSETVFVFPPQKPEHTRQLRIFTPGAEVPFAGHPTVGTAHVLAAIGEIQLIGQQTDIVFEEGVGPVPVSIYAVDGQPASSQLSAAVMPEFGPEPPAAPELAAMLSLDEADVRQDAFAPQAASCGLPFLFVPLRNRDALRRARIDQGKWEKLLSNYWASQVFVFTQEAELDGSDLRARMFAPALGITEDPATGSAATALAGYLGARDATTTGTLKWVVEQGFEMGRPSILNVEADKHDGDIVAIRVGGSSVLVSEGQMEIPM